MAFMAAAIGLVESLMTSRLSVRSRSPGLDLMDESYISPDCGGRMGRESYAAPDDYRFLGCVDDFWVGGGNVGISRLAHRRAPRVDGGANGCLAGGSVGYGRGCEVVELRSAWSANTG